MRSMTDFIDAVSNSEQLAVYNEDYSWAEEYAEYYNEESDNYAQPILESSGYQFFGEACFIQEASKGLIAGGILALVSGAFFMIMKLLRNGGNSSSGSSSSSSNNSNKSSDNNSRPSSNGGGNNNNRPPTNPPDGSSPQLQSLNDEKLKAAQAELQKVKEERQKAEEETRRTLQRMDQMQKENDAKLKAQNDAFDARIKADREAKAKAEKEKAAAHAAEEEKRRKALLEESKRKAEEAKKAKKAEEDKRKAEEAAYVKPAELEAEEDLVFNAKIIIDELNKLKKQGYDETNVRNGHELYTILQGLEKIDEITDFLVKLVKDGRWEIFGSSTTEKGFAETFHRKCTELHEIVKTIQLESSKINNENEPVHDISIDIVISDIKNIDKVTKDIESKCKEGMKLCKAERTKLINAKKDVSNVDKAYKILNGIIRDVNVVCKNIQTAFRTVHKAFTGKRHPYPLKVGYWNDARDVGWTGDKFYDVKDEHIWEAYTYKMLNSAFEERGIRNNDFFKKLTKSLVSDCETIFYANDRTTITDFDIKNIDKFSKGERDKRIKRIQDAIKNIPVFMNRCKKVKPQFESVIDYIEQVIIKGYNLLIDLYNVDPKSLVGQKASECNNSAVVKLHDFCNDYLFNEKPKAEDIRDKLTDIYEGKTKESSAVTDSLPPNTPVGKFYDDIGKNMNKLEGVLEDRYLSRFKSSYEKGLKMFNDPDEDEEDVFSEIYQSLRKNVWERQNTLSNDNLKHLIAFISSIGFKEVNISEGKKITPQDGKYFKEIFKQPTDDASLNFTIKKIYEHPMEMNISLEGDNFNAILPGKASMYRLKG